MRKRIDGGEKRRERRKEAKKEETKEEKNGRPRGPVRPRKWKRRREMAVSIIPETMTDRHRYSGWKPSRIRDKDGDTLTPGINLSKDEAAVSVVNSGIPTSFAYIYIYIYTHCCGPVTMPAGRLIQWMGSRDGSPRLRDRSATTADLMDDTRQAFDSRSIWKLVRIAWKVLIYGWNAYALNT